MTIEQKALELVNAVKRERREPPLGLYRDWHCDRPETVALIRALEAHDADKARHAAEMREQAKRFSEAVRAYMVRSSTKEDYNYLCSFILPAADPLAELAAHYGINPGDLLQEAEARGLSIVAKAPE